MKIFVLLSRVPYPLEKGDKLRAFHIVKELSKNHDIHLVCLSDKNPHPKAEEKLKPFCSSFHIFKLNKAAIYLRVFLNIISDKPYQVAYFYQRKIQNQISEFIDDIKPDRILCQLIRTSEYVKNEHNYIKTLDYMDALSKGMQRRIKTSPLLMKPILSAEYRRLLKYENLIFDYFEYHTIISEPDKELIYHPQKNSIKVIPNGVNMNYFHSVNNNKPYDLVFIGNMSYPPNIDCAIYIKQKVLPILRQSKPTIKILIAGASPAREILRLQSENIHVSGWVPDIRDAYNSAKVFIAPMQIGTGQQNKLLEAMSMKLPCITTPLANDAIGAADKREIVIVNDEQEAANACFDLLDNPEFYKEIAENGHTFVKSKFSWQKTAKNFEDVLLRNTII